MKGINMGWMIAIIGGIILSIIIEKKEKEEKND